MSCVTDSWQEQNISRNFMIAQPKESVHATSGAQSPSKPVDTGGSFFGQKYAGVWKWLFTSIHWWNQECMVLYFSSPIQFQVGTRERSWLSHYAISRKVADSIPDGVTGIFHWHNPSGRTMALGLTQPLTEISTRNIFWGVKAAWA